MEKGYEYIIQGVNINKMLSFFVVRDVNLNINKMLFFI